MMDYDVRRLTMSKTAYKRVVAEEHNVKYLREKADAAERARKSFHDRFGHVRESLRVIKGDAHVDQDGVVIASGAGEVEIEYTDKRGPILISGGELGRHWAREHIARIEAGEDCPGIVKPFIPQPRYYQRGRW